MKTNEHQLLKHFATVLRNRANGNNEPISPTLLKYLSRKDLVEVIRKIHNGNIPKVLDLTLMENEELLAIIKDEMFVISFITEKWTRKSQVEDSKEGNVIPKAVDKGDSKRVAIPKSKKQENEKAKR